MFMDLLLSHLVLQVYYDYFNFKDLNFANDKLPMNTPKNLYVYSIGSLKLWNITYEISEMAWLITESRLTVVSHKAKKKQVVHNK